MEATAGALGFALSDVPTIISMPGGADQSTVLAAKSLSLDPIPAHLNYVATPDGVKLAWDLVLRTVDGDHWYNVSVDATTGNLLLASDWVDDAAAYHIFPLPIEHPNDGSRQIVVNPAHPAASPFGWHDTNGVAGAELTDTRGNNVFAQEDADNNNTGGFRPGGGTGLLFDSPLNLAQQPANYQAAAITNLFYWNNILHDVHARYGFTEAAGNFQQTNYSGAGLGNDPVQADAQDGSGTNNANFSTPPDGTPPRMQQYIFTFTAPNRDSDFDSGIIVHEYGHGVSNRLTGGPANSNALDALQSGGMGEGWSDWWSLMFKQASAADTTNAAGVGTYVLGQPASGLGIRQYRYDFDIGSQPVETFLNFGTGASQSTAVHAVGTRWASTLWDLNHLLIQKYGFDADLLSGYSAGGAGNKLALQLVMDGLKLQPALPSFIAARNAILQADQVLTGGVNRREIWTAFARRGLGFSAATANSNATTMTTAFDLLPALANPGIIAQTPTGTINTQPNRIDFTFSEVMNQTSFDPMVDVTSFTGPGNVDLRRQITGFTWLDGTTLRINFNNQAAQGSFRLIIGPDVLAVDNNSPLDQDADGTAGEVTDDRYTAAFRYDAIGMKVSSTTPADSSTITLPFTTLDVNFNEPYASASIGADDLELSQGTVTGVTLLDADTVRYTLSGVSDQSLMMILNMKYAAVTDVFGFPLQAYAGSFSVLDVITTPYPTPLSAIAPLGSLRPSNG